MTHYEYAISLLSLVENLHIWNGVYDYFAGFYRIMVLSSFSLSQVIMFSVTSDTLSRKLTLDTPLPFAAAAATPALSVRGSP